MKRFIQNILINILLTDGGLEEKRIDRKNKRIHFGFYSLEKMFFGPHHNLACIILQKWFKYSFWEETIQFNSHWCDSGDKVNEDFWFFNRRFNEEKGKVINRNLKIKENDDVEQSKI